LSAYWAKIEGRDFAVIFLIFSKLRRDFADFLP